jgi:hypothetical protein
VSQLTTRRRASVPGAGIFKDAGSDALVRNAFFSAAILNWQIVIPDFGMMTGPLQVTALEYSGQCNSEVMFELRAARCLRTLDGNVCDQVWPVTKFRCDRRSKAACHIDFRAPEYTCGDSSELF